MRKNEYKKIGNSINRLFKNSDKIVCGLIGLLMVSALICSFIYQNETLLKYIYRISLVLQVLVISVVIIFSHYIRYNTWGKELTTEEAGALSDKEKKIMESCGYSSDERKWIKAKKIANNALSEFKRFWYWIWFSWLFLYMAYFIRYCLKIREGNTKIIDFFLNPLSNANTLMLLICYLILFEITLADEQTGISEKPNWAPWASLFLIITFAEIMIRSLALSNATYENYAKIFDWINGITSGAVMALFVGAFDNEFIKPKFIYIAPLYLYMAIQAIFPTYLNHGENLAITVLICITTLVCKTILFLFVVEQIKSGRLLFYFIRIRKLHNDFDDKWKKFLRATSGCKEKGASKNKKTGRPITP